MSGETGDWRALPPHAAAWGELYPRIWWDLVSRRENVDDALAKMRDLLSEPPSVAPRPAPAPATATTVWPGRRYSTVEEGLSRAVYRGLRAPFGRANPYKPRGRGVALRSAWSYGVLAQGAYLAALRRSGAGGGDG